MKNIKTYESFLGLFNTEEIISDEEARKILDYLKKNKEGYFADKNSIYDKNAVMAEMLIVKVVILGNNILKVYYLEGGAEYNKILKISSTLYQEFEELKEELKTSTKEYDNKVKNKDTFKNLLKKL
jgi:predicted DNA binding protein